MRNFKIRNSNKTLAQTARIQTALFELGFCENENMYQIGDTIK